MIFIHTLRYASYTDNGPKGVTMKKYSFSVDGIPVEINSAITKVGDVTDYDTDGVKVMLTVDSQSDFRLEYLDKNNIKPREPHISLAALSCFFKRVRGYPDMALDIAVDDRIFKLSLNEYPNYSFRVKDVKCKVLCAKTVEFCDGVCVAVDVIDDCGGCAALICSDTECFDKSRATLIHERLRGNGISSLVVISYTDRIGIITLGDITPYEAIVIGLSLLSSRGISVPTGRYTSKVNGVDIALQRTSSGTVFYPEIKCIS